MIKMINKLIGAIQMSSHVEKVHRANGFKPSTIKQTIEFIWTVFRS